MSIEIIPINGKSQYLNYEIFESTLKSSIQNRCHDAKVFIFNNFPVSISVETTIDIILVIAINPISNNYYSPKTFEDKLVYLNNLIIPIKFISHLKNDLIEIDDENQLISNNEYIDYSTEINSIRFGLIKYLANKCGFISDHLYIQPIIFIKNEDEYFLDNYIISKSFDFITLKKYLAKCSQNIFSSYREWRTEIGYLSIPTDIEQITNQASKDSEIGYLTKKKVERISKHLSSSKIIFEELNKNLVIISGKAGTGKSSELLLLTMKCISNEKNTLYLTYNKLLIFDISKTIKSFVNSNINNDSKPGESSVLTLHAFFYRLSKSLGVLHILKADRIEKLLISLKERMRINYDLISNKLILSQEINYNFLKTEIQNNITLDIATREVGIDFINFLKKKNVTTILELNKYSKEFYNYKKRIVGNIQANEVFLADYYGVLEDTLLQIQNPEQFFIKYNIENKFEILDVAIGLNKKYIDENEGVKTISESGFTEFKNRRVGGFKRKRTLFIDEAQDCHRLEKEILLSIYGSDNIVIANGGKEQLIRHVEMCNWEIFQTKKISIKKHYTRNKSYRVKKTIVDFCNFVANKFNIDLNLEPLESEDEGELIFDFRQNHSEVEISDIFNHLNLKGKVNGCSAYESLLILLEANSQRNGIDRDENSEKAVINEYGNIEDSTNLRRGTWDYLETLKKNGFMFWDGTIGNKSELIPPSQNESRIIYYESCRGLEAWSVACFAMDKFFNQKREEPDAEKYLIEDLFLNQDNEQRKNMFATTWLIMAMTRVIDTLYIQVNDRNSTFGKIVDEYINQKNKNVREITNIASH